MKKIICLVLVAVTLVLCLSSCSMSYAAASLKSKLEGAGYKVDEYSKVEFEAAQRSVALKTSEMDGLEKVLYAYKKTADDSEEGILILVFDSIKNADKYGSTSDNKATETMGLLYDFGRKIAPETDTSVYGTANNLIWAGSSAAKKSAGIQ